MKDTATFQKVLAVLNAAPLRYKIVFDDGTEFGGLTLESLAKKKQRSTEREYGSIAKALGPLLQDFKVGEVRTLATLDLPDFTTTQMLSNISSYCCRHWGNGAAMACMTEDRKMVEAMRVK